jgi:hypothetical protein
MQDFIKDLDAKQFTVKDMVNFAIAMQEKPNFDTSSVELWYNRRIERQIRLLKAITQEEC